MVCPLNSDQQRYLIAEHGSNFCIGDTGGISFRYKSEIIIIKADTRQLRCKKSVMPTVLSSTTRGCLYNVRLIAVVKLILFQRRYFTLITKTPVQSDGGGDI